MNVYEITRSHDDGRAIWDANWAFVIWAKSEVNARKLASEAAGDEGMDIWLNSDITKCVLIGMMDWDETAEEMIILADGRWD